MCMLCLLVRLRLSRLFLVFPGGACTERFSFARESLYMSVTLFSSSFSGLLLDCRTPWLCGSLHIDQACSSAPFPADGYSGRVGERRRVQPSLHR